MKKLFKKKKSLSQRHITKQTKAIVDIGKAPIIGVSITIADGATVTTTSKAISLLCEALGEDKTVEWHSKYMEKFRISQSGGVFTVSHPQARDTEIPARA